MKKRLLYLILSLTLLIAVCIPTTVAWFMRGDRTDMTLELLEINSLVTLYRANDGNLNGVPDLAPSSVAMKYYTELYDFVDPVSDYAQSDPDGGQNETGNAGGFAGERLYVQVCHREQQRRR